MMVVETIDGVVKSPIYGVIVILQVHQQLTVNYSQSIF